MDAYSCMLWVKRGVSNPEPTTVELSSADYKKLMKEKPAELDSESESDVDEENGSEVVSATKEKALTNGTKNQSSKKDKASKNNFANTNKDKELSSSDISDSDESDISDSEENDDSSSNLSDNEIVYDAAGIPVNKEIGGNQLTIAGVVHDNSDAQNAYLTKPYVDSDEEDLNVQSNDNLLVTSRVTGEGSNMEVHIYNRYSKSFFIHHDIMLDSYPICMEWINYDPADGSAGNLAAIGSMKSEIDLWDIDFIDAVAPSFVLKGKKKKGKKNKKKKAKLLGHTDAVLGLSWNKLEKHILASGSVDTTVGLWDLNDGVMVTAMDDHTDRVQSLEWHPAEPTLLLTGSADQTVKTFDCERIQSHNKSWNLSSDVEKVLWNYHNPFSFLVGTDSGRIHYYDVRHNNPIFKMKAHKEEITGLSLSSSVPGCLFSTSSDGKLKVWDIRKPVPSLIYEKKCHIGDLYSMSACPDEMLTIAVGGESEVKIYELGGSSVITKKFRLKDKYKTKKVTCLSSFQDDDADDLSSDEMEVEEGEDEVE